MALTLEHYQKLKSIIHKELFHPHEAKLLWEMFCQSEGFSIGSPNCPDCVFKMKDRLLIRYYEFENAQQNIEASPLDEAVEQVREYAETQNKLGNVNNNENSDLR